MTATDRIVKFLGGNRTIGRRVRDDEDLVALIRAGLPFESFQELLKHLGVSKRALEQSLRLPSRTVLRRQREGHLRAEESDKLVRLARVLAHASVVLDGVKPAVDWMKTQNRALAMAVPLELMDTDAGARRVDDALGRLEFGVFS
jgi:putative toxin-antitoxin system antitoxin component (TIGR02293 family)